MRRSLKGIEFARIGWRTLRPGGIQHFWRLNPYFDVVESNCGLMVHLEDLLRPTRLDQIKCRKCINPRTRWFKWWEE